MALVLSTQKPVVGVARIDWASFLATQPEVPDLLDNFKHRKKDVIGEVSEDLVISTIKDALCNVLGHSDLDFTMPLMDMGLDSLSSMEFRNRLQAGKQLKPTHPDSPRIELVLPSDISGISRQTGSKETPLWQMRIGSSRSVNRSVYATTEQSCV